MGESGMRRCRGALLAALVLLVTGCSSGIAPTLPVPVGTIVGWVVDLDGAPVEDAEVAAAGGTARTGPDGSFTIPAPPEGAWVRVTHPGHLSRTRAGAPGDPLLVRLTPDDGQTVSLL
ncbi:MAG: carboxypeptidase-like regulatory domain-containing protein, partial [Actinomycetes bacterium]